MLSFRFYLLWHRLRFKARRRQLGVSYMTRRAVMNRYKFCGSTDFVDCSFFGFLVRSAFDRVSGQQNYRDEAQKPFAFD